MHDLAQLLHGLFPLLRALLAKRRSRYRGCKQRPVQRGFKRIGGLPLAACLDKSAVVVIQKAKFFVRRCQLRVKRNGLLQKSTRAVTIAGPGMKGSLLV